MSLGNIVAMLGAGMSGYGRGIDDARRREREDEDRKFQEWQRQQQQDEAARQAALRGDLQDAYAERSMTTAAAPENAQRPATMDDRDVGQAGEAPVAVPNKYVVGKQTYTDQAQAQTALGQENSPQAQAQRAGRAFVKAGQPSMALQVRRDADQSELTRLNLDKAHRDFANQKFDDDVNATPTWDEFTGYLSNHGTNVKAIPSADGKQVTIAKINPDGSVSPFDKHTYSNDDEGLALAKGNASKSISLADKIKIIEGHVKAGLDASKAADEHELHQAQAGYWQGEVEAQKARAAASNKANDFTKSPLHQAYADNIAKQQKLQETIQKGVADGSLQPGSPQMIYLEDTGRALAMQRRALEQRISTEDTKPAAAGRAPTTGPGTGATAVSPDRRMASVMAEGASLPNGTPAQDADMKAEGGRQIIRDEIGGDVERAKAVLKAMREQADTMPPDARGHALDMANELEAGINSWGKDGKGKGKDSTPAEKPAAKELPKMSKKSDPFASSDGRIPPPPPEKLAPSLMGGEKPNPAFKAWLAKGYTLDAYKKQQADDDKAQEAQSATVRAKVYGR